MKHKQVCIGGRNFQPAPLLCSKQETSLPSTTICPLLQILNLSQQTNIPLTLIHVSYYSYLPSELHSLRPHVLYEKNLQQLPLFRLNKGHSKHKQSSHLLSSPVKVGLCIQPRRPKTQYLAEQKASSALQEYLFTSFKSNTFSIWADPTAVVCPKVSTTDI